MRLVWARHPPGPRTTRREFGLKTERPVDIKPDPVLPGVHRHRGGDFIAARAAGKKGATTPSPSATDSTRVDAAGGSAWHHVRHIPMPLRHEVLRLSYAVSFGIRLRCPFSSRLIQDQGSATSGRSPSSHPLAECVYRTVQFHSTLQFWQWRTRASMPLFQPDHH